VTVLEGRPERSQTAPGPEARLASLEARVRALEQARQSAPSPLRRADRDLLSRVLPAIAGLVGSDSFTSRDLAASSALRLVLGDRSVKTIGRLLSRGADLAIDGFMVQRAGAELRVTLWRLVAVVSDGEKPPRATPDGRRLRREDIA